jgi:hypothetical protein
MKLLRFCSQRSWKTRRHNQDLPESRSVFSSVIWHHEIWQRYTDVLEKYPTSIFRLALYLFLITCLAYSSKAKIGEDGGTTFLLYGWNPPHDTALHLRGKYHSSVRIQNYYYEWLWEPQMKFIWRDTRSYHVRWVPCHHGMARPQVADGGDALPFWREAANILNKQSRTADKGWSSSLGVGRGANNSSP